MRPLRTAGKRISWEGSGALGQPRQQAAGQEEKEDPTQGRPAFRAVFPSQDVRGETKKLNSAGLSLADPGAQELESRASVGWGWGGRTSKPPVWVRGVGHVDPSPSSYRLFRPLFQWRSALKLDLSIPPTAVNRVVSEENQLSCSHLG